MENVLELIQDDSWVVNSVGHNRRWSLCLPWASDLNLFLVAGDNQCAGLCLIQDHLKII